MKRVFTVALALCAPWPLAAQNAITQEGTVLQNSPMMFRGNNRARQGATVQGAPTGQILTTGDATVGGRCDYSAPTDAADGYYRICIDGKTGTLRLDGSKSPPLGTLKLEINGTVYELPASAAIVGSDAVVGNNEALKMATGAVGKRLVRLGFMTPGDGGLATYNWSDVNCVLPDEGARVQPTGVTGCWVADFSSLRPNPVVWGAKGDGVTDDRAAVQAAVDAMAGKTLYVGPYRYCIGAPGIVTVRPITLVGETSSNRYETPANQYGFVACAPNINMLTFTKDATNAASGSALVNVAFDAGAAGNNTSGSAIKWVGTTNTSMDNVRVTKACIGVDIAWAHSLVMDGVNVTSDGVSLSPGCGGIRIGNESTLGDTVDIRITNTTVDVKGDWNLWVQDAGGLFIDKSDFLFAVVGTLIRPRIANQYVTWLFANSVALSDSTCSTGLVIDTTSPSQRVTGLHFNQTWTASAGNNGPAGCLGAGVGIDNHAAGTVNGIHFVGHRSYSNGAQGFVLGTGVDNVTIDNSEVCANGTEKANVPANSYDGIAVSAGAKKVALRNNRVGGDCVYAGAWNGLQAMGIFLHGDNTDLTIVGNDLRGNAVQSLAATTVPFGGNVIRDNLNVDDIILNVAAAASMAIPMGVNFGITGGSTTISNITGMWDGRTVVLVPTIASQTFTAGSGVCNAKTVAQYEVVLAYKIPGVTCTYLK